VGVKVGVANVEYISVKIFILASKL